MTDLTMPEVSARRAAGRNPLAAILLLLMILAAAASMRLVGMDWDEGYHLHPDERFLSDVTSNLTPVSSLREYFDTNNSTLNPNNVAGRRFGFYVYGNFPTIVTRYVSGWLEKESYYENYLVGRGLSAGADILTLLVLFLIGWELFDERVGLIAAALYGAAALPIQQSHFYTVDTFTTLFVTAAFYFAARLVNHHRWVDYILFGVMLGLAMSSKVSIFPFAIVLIIALIVRILRERQISKPTREASDIESAPETLPDTRKLPQPEVVRAAAGLIIAGIITVLVFRVGQPYAFLPPGSDVSLDSTALGPGMTLVSQIGEPIGFRPNPLWLNQMNEVKRQVSGQVDMPPNHQWGHQPKLIFPWVNMVRIGMGWPLGLWCWFAFAWALWEIARHHRDSLKLLLPVVWIALYFTWQGIGWVMSMRYFLPIYPFLILLGGWAVITAWDRVQALLAERGARQWHPASLTVAATGTLIVLSAFAWGFAVSRIYTRPVTRVAATRWMLEGIPSDVTLEFSGTGDAPNVFQLGLPNNWPDPLPPEEIDQTQPPAYYTRIEGGSPNVFQFSVPFSGTLSGLRLNRVIDPENRSGYKLLRVAISTTSDDSGILTEASVVDPFSAETDPRGRAYDVKIAPTEITANQPYWLFLQPDSDGPLVLSGSAIAVEGDWDDPLPLNLAPYNIWDAQFHAYEFEMAWEDEAPKRARMEYILNHADYIAISSNRFYDSLSRNPNRFPLSIEYYKALFSGELGFEIVGDFTSRPTLGPFEFYDDRAEEAWTVYDHPRALIFRKTPAYDADRTAEILSRADLASVQKVIASQSQGSPIRLTPPVIGSQALLPREAGYNIEAAPLPSSELPGAGFWRSAQPFTVIIWWIVIGLIGWIAFPLLFTLFPGLPDRGLGISRIFGMLLAAWGAWVLASLHLMNWSALSILLVLVVVAAISATLLTSRRREFTEWLSTNRSHIVFTEATLLAMFLFFLAVRLGNPDLWHISFGGEKPMDMSYFNAVLNSKTFPPYDPWFAGGTINYYYFGFVIVGMPVKLLGIPTTVAYNLILPTLFAVTGFAAFSAAYNLLAHDTSADLLATDGEETLDEGDEAGLTLWQALRAWPRVSAGEVLDAAGRTLRRSGSPHEDRRAYLAGFGAMLMAVLLGNLDQVRTIIWKMAELGAGQPSWTVTLLPNPQNLVKGFNMVADGALLPGGIGQWYWNATRLIPVPIVGNTPIENGPITEFPYFTFLYADLHAHMMALSITVMALNWAIAQIRTSVVPGQSRMRSMLWWLGNLLTGGLIIGALRPTNTWDWPTYLAIGSAALLCAQIIRREDRAAFPALGVGGVVALILGGMMYQFNSQLAQNPDTASSVLMRVGASGLVGFLLGYGLTLLFITVRRRSAESEAQPAFGYSWITLILGGIQAAALAALTTILYLPYIRSYKLGYTSAVPWLGSKTPIWAYLDIHGLFLFLITSWLVYETWQWWHSSNEANTNRRSTSLLVAIVALAIVGLGGLIFASGLQVALVAVPLMAWSLILFLRSDQRSTKRLVLLLVMIGLALSLVVELVVLGGDLSRMNTVFKFYLQIWILFAIAAGASLGWVWPVITRTRAVLRMPWLMTFATLVFLAALYPITATRAKVMDRWYPNAPRTLDGMAFMQFAEYSTFNDVERTLVVFPLRPDYEALRWLQDNVKGTPVVLEAQLVEYQWGNRVAIYTGFPAVVGWNWHQRQQRGWQAQEVTTRVDNVQEMYNTGDIQRTLELLRQYRVDLIMVGELERAKYAPAGIAKFEQMETMGYLRLIYERDGTLIYEVIHTQVDAS